MNSRVCGAMAAMLVAAGTAALVAQGARGGGIPCDRACLTGIADAYIAALVAHNPSKAPMANVKFTEQAQQQPLGEGLWKTAVSASATYKIAVPDPVAGQVGVFVMMKADVGPEPPSPNRGKAPPPPPQKGPADIQLALRLKVQNRLITEAEHIYARIAQPSQLANLQTPRPAFAATVPLAERSPRTIMLLIGNSYYDSIVQSDGDAAPYADDCGRRENGMHTAGVGAPPPPPTAPPPTAPPPTAPPPTAPPPTAPPPTAPTPSGAAPRGGGPPGGFRIQGCREQMSSRAMSYINSIDLRRVWIADEEKGLVFGLTMFRHPMTEKFVTIVNTDGTTTERPMNFNPFDFAAAHIFKISGGKIHEIEAMGFSLAFNSKNGWSQFLR